MEDNKVKDFWLWFTKKKDELQSDKISNDDIKLLDKKIEAIGFQNWELRAGLSKQNMLIISPGGKLSLLGKTKDVMSQSPELVDWEFYYYKPAKIWNYKFSIDDFDSKRMIDAEDWEYVLLKFPDNTYDILIKGTTLNSLPEEYRLVAADIVLENIVGEELSLTLINNIELVDEFPNEYLDKKSSIKSLKMQFEELE